MKRWQAVTVGTVITLLTCAPTRTTQQSTLAETAERVCEAYGELARLEERAGPITAGLHERTGAACEGLEKLRADERGGSLQAAVPRTTLDDRAAHLSALSREAVRRAVRIELRYHEVRYGMRTVDPRRFLAWSIAAWRDAHTLAQGIDDAYASFADSFTQRR